jgi:hypothetical protein
MAVSRFSTSTVAQGLPKYQKLYDGTTILNAYASIQTITVGSGGTANITFSNIPQNFKHLQVRAVVRSTSSTTYDNVVAQLNGDSGNNYSGHLSAFGDGATNPPPSYSYASSSSTTTMWITGGTANANYFGGFIMDISDYTNTNKYKTTKSVNGADNNATNTYMSFGSTAWMNKTDKITSITFKSGYGNNFAQYSTFALYGLVG